MATNEQKPIFPMGLDAEKPSALAGFNNTGNITHGPDAVMQVPVSDDTDVVDPSAVRYNADSDEFEGSYSDGWRALGGGGIRWEMATSQNNTYAPEVGRGYFIDSRTASAVVTLPAEPKRVGLSVSFADLFGGLSAHPMTIKGNGNNLYGAADDMVIHTDNAAFTLTWTGEEQGWIVTSAVGLGSGRTYRRNVFETTLTQDITHIDIGTVPEMVDIYINGARIPESGYRIAPNGLDFNDTIRSGSLVSVLEYKPFQLMTDGTERIAELESKITKLEGTPIPVTWSGYDGGADTSGSTPSDPAFSAVDISATYIPYGSYNLSNPWAPVGDNASIDTDADAYFTGAKPNFVGLIPFQGGPIWSGKLFKKTYQSDKWSGFGNIFQSAHYATSYIPDSPGGGANVVALYSGADAKGPGSSVWAANLVSYANNATSTAIGIELNYGSLVDGGLGYGLLIASAGYYGAQAGIQLQTNNANSRMKQGLRFNNRSVGLAVDYLIGVSGDETVSPANYGIDFSRHSFPSAELSFKSFLVDATKANTVSRLKVSGAATGGSPSISVDSTDANVNVAITAKGTGQLLFNTNGVEGFRVSASGLSDSLAVNQGTGYGSLTSRGTSTDVSIYLIPKGAGTVRLQSNLSLASANSYTCATSDKPWSGGFTQTAFTITSDERYKTAPLDITEEILDAWAEVNFAQFQYLDRVEEKGQDGARWHFGILAQRAKESFEKHGLDAHNFGFLCYDEWESSEAVIDEETGVVISEAVEAGNRYGVRYEEILILEAALQRRNYQRMESKYEDLLSRVALLESK